ncbi:MAG TPA: alpha/beta fold hydrolase [Burkholderiales bacterium]|nr:alpha/beta fold hydrolase [Burkholderiales bacterium]
MLARFLIVVLALQLGLFWAAGLALCARLGWPAWWSLAFAPAGVLVLEALTVAQSFALSRLYAGGAPQAARLSWGGRLRLFCCELGAYVLLFTFMQPFARRRVSGAAVSGMPVVLVPGIYCNAGLWGWMRRRLAKLGVAGTWAVTLEPPRAGIDALAERLAQEIARVCAAAGAQRVVVVGHSMGGLVARACLRDPAARARIARIVTLGTPHHGSALALWGIGQNARQMRPGSAWLAALNAGATDGVPVVSVFSWHDNFVAPQDSPALAGAQNVPLAGIGHLSLAFSDEVARRVAAEVAAAQK